MKVILNRDVPNLGEEGDICEVARGYARNFLMPRNLVLINNRQNIALIEGRRASIEQRKIEKRTEASSTKERIEGEELVIRMAAGDRGKLFGSVTTANIVDELEKRGVSIERRKVEIPDGTIKSVGVHPVRIRLYGDEEAVLNVRVETEVEAAAAATAPAEKGPETTEVVSHAPVVEESVIDEPVVDEPVVDEPVADEPVADEPVIDEPVAETSEPETDETAEESSI